MLKCINEEIAFYSSVSLISGPAGPQGEPGVAGKQFQFSFCLYSRYLQEVSSFNNVDIVVSNFSFLEIW